MVTLGNNFLPIKFLSTLPARGATGDGLLDGSSHLNFYPRSPRGERLVSGLFHTFQE